MNSFEFLIVPLIFAFSIIWFHELGHAILARKLGYRIIALSFSLLVFPSGVFREETNNKKHQKIIAAGGPLGGLFAFVFFGITLNLISSLSPFILVVGLAMALLSSIIDFMELFSCTSRLPESDMLNIKINLLRRAWLLVFSEKLWVKSKTKIERQIGRKINFRKIILG